MKKCDLFTFNRRHLLKGIIDINDGFYILHWRHFDETIKKLCTMIETCEVKNNEKTGYSRVYMNKILVEEKYYL